MEETHKARSSRRAGWIAAGAAAAILLAGGLSFLWPVLVEARAVRTLEAAGASVKTHSWGPKWLVDLAWEWLPRTVQVSFDNTPGEGEWAALSRCRGLYDLSLDNTNVTDAGLEYLKDLANLRRLYLSDTAVTDAGLVHLKSLAMLNHLYVANTAVTAAGVVELKQAVLHPLQVER